jgi:transposase
MMCPAIDNPASCEIRAVIRFLHAKNMSDVEIHRESCAAVCGQNVMSEGTVRQWCRMFKDGRANVHNEERSGRPSAVSDDLVQSVDQKNYEKRSVLKIGLLARSQFVSGRSCDRPCREWFFNGFSRS